MHAQRYDEKHLDEIREKNNNNRSFLLINLIHSPSSPSTRYIPNKNLLKVTSRHSELLHMTQVKLVAPPPSRPGLTCTYA